METGHRNLDRRVKMVWVMGVVAIGGIGKVENEVGGFACPGKRVPFE